LNFRPNRKSACFLFQQYQANRNMRPSRSERPFDPSEYPQAHATSQPPSNDNTSLRAWLKGALRTAIPHEAVLCGLARRHALGYVPVRVVSEGLPHSYLADDAQGERIQCLALERWVESGVPQFMSGRNAMDERDRAAMDQLRQNGLRNVAVAGYSDTDERLLSFFCLYNLPDIAQIDPVARMEVMAPMVHHALTRVWTEREATGPEVKPQAALPRRDTSAVHLTCKELEVLEQVRLGHSNKKIGQLLNKSPLTVKTQVRSLLMKLQVPNRTALACQSRRHDEPQRRS